MYDVQESKDAVDFLGQKKKEEKYRTKKYYIILCEVSMYSAYKWQGFEAKDLKEKYTVYIH